MVSFSCEGCGDVLTKKKLSGHYNQCWAPVTCLDCMTTFPNGTFQSHTSCISEAQKYQGHLYRPEKDGKKGKTENRKSINGHSAYSQTMVPRGAYVEDAPDGDEMNAVAVVDVPPRAPTPPAATEPAGELPENINVFDFLVSDATPKAAQLGAPDERRMLEQSTPHNQGSKYSQYSNGRGVRFLEQGYSYGNAPIQPGMERFDSWSNLADSQDSFVTPANKDQRKKDKDRKSTEKSGSKRKRNVEELDLSSVKRPGSRDEPMHDAPGTGGRVLHSGLTGGLNRLVTDPDFYDDRIEAGPTPISPLKRSKRERDFDEVKKDRRKSAYVSYSVTKVPPNRDDKNNASRGTDRRQESDRHDKHRRKQREDSYSSEEQSRASRRPRAIEYPDRPSSVQPSATNQLVSYRSRAELFLSFVTKGPDSDRGVSLNKALKRYHREREVRSGEEKEDEDKELWKSLRLRRNSRGEIVLFV